MNHRIVRLVLVGLLASVPTGLWALDPIEGYWMAPPKNEKAESTVVRFYSHENRVYGKIVAGVDSKGNLVQDPSSGIGGLGMDPYFGLSQDGENWSGLYIDPAGGGEFNLKIHKSGTNLSVRFEVKGLSFLGHKKTWRPLTESQQALLERTSVGESLPRRP